MFDVGLGEMAILVVLALVIFGDKLPQVAGQAGRMLRQFREMANSAKADLQEGLGPEFKDFDIADLNPKTFVRKHLFEDDDILNGKGGLFDDEPSFATTTSNAKPQLANGERPPFDPEAT
ncbi:Sec-independent protein translocase subunit TatB [Actinomadura spongiicola]|uniref:Sec-independent protein translocase subunit TatB n=1 Tax=Actinomadura spongiicola TaxID=2303421 RepID=A0A372GI63_9ACTN|nr:sec-independent translocase [Actinomadura spongiicola]RFS84872.1 Sec-independent protein translocase subunit TatB [Actinomadura spongiicola]